MKTGRFEFSGVEFSGGRLGDLKQVFGRARTRKVEGPVWRAYLFRVSRCAEGLGFSFLSPPILRLVSVREVDLSPGGTARFVYSFLWRAEKRLRRLFDLIMAHGVPIHLRIDRSESSSGRLPSPYPSPEWRRPVISRAGGEIWYHISFAPRSSRFESARVQTLIAG